MLNINTVLSVFDDKPTLLKWLKKVEAALNNASLENVSINSAGENQVTLTFHFADETSITSDPITLPAGPQGVQGIQGPPGPEGPQGEPGKNGADGTSFQIVENVASAAALPQASATYLGQAYSVGTGYPYDIYVCERTASSYTWINHGPISGVEGPAGPEGPQGDPGEPGLNPMGEWVSGNEYHATSNDFVTYQGSAYLCIANVNGSTTPPPADSTHWLLYVSKGDTGAQGQPGEDGAPGEQGPTGLGALTCNEVQSTDTEVVANTTVFMVAASAFNRTPVAGDICTIITQGTDSQAGKVWICSCVFEEEVSGEYLFEVTGAAEVQGGSSGVITVIMLTGVSGILTEEQLRILVKSPASVVISINNDIYALHRLLTSTAIYQYIAHNGSDGILESIYDNVLSITLSNGAWALTSQQNNIPTAGENNQIITIGAKSGTLTSEQLTKLKANPAETIFYYDDEDYYMRLSAGTGTTSYTYMDEEIDAETGLITKVHVLTLTTATGAWSIVDYTTSGSSGGLTVIDINLGASSGTLSDDDFAKVQANPQNVVFYSDEDIYQLDSYEASTPYYQYRKIVPNSAKNGFYDNILRIGAGGAWTYTENTISGGGGTQLYRHVINFTNTSDKIELISSRSTQYTYSEQIIEDMLSYGTGIYRRSNSDKNNLIVAYDEYDERPQCVYAKLDASTAPATITWAYLNIVPWLISNDTVTQL